MPSVSRNTRGIDMLALEWSTDVSQVNINDAVQMLMEWAEMYGPHATDTSSRAASILLSCYCGDCWRFNPGELANFDPDLRQAALVAIEGRSRGLEPHRTIKNGSARFQRLWQAYEGTKWFVRPEADAAT